LTKASRGFLELLKVILKEQGKESFHAREIRQQLRIAPTTLKRHLSELERYGYLKVSRGSRYGKYEYSIADYAEYDQLKSTIHQHLQAILDIIRSRK
jgi:DNA-binding HxlR family transcriptional regulator